MYGNDNNNNAPVRLYTQDSGFLPGASTEGGMFLLFTYTAELARCHDRQLCLFGFHFSA